MNGGMKIAGLGRWALVALGLALAGCGEKPRVLRLYTWFEYTAPEVVTAFEQKYNCTVKIVTFASNEEMIANLRDKGCGDYDIIVPSAHCVRQMAKEGMIVPVDHAKCPNVKRNLMAEYARMLPEDSELCYSVPYGIEHSVLMCATNRIPSGVDVNTWAVLGNPALKGHVFIVDDMRDVLGISLIFRGCSPNTEDAGEIAAAADQVLRWASNVAQWGGDDSLFAKGVDGGVWLWLAYGDTAIQMIGEDGPAASWGLALVRPREGCAFSSGVLTVSSGCRDPDLAHAFIDFLYANPDMGAAHMAFNGCLLPSAPALEELSPRMRELIVPSSETLSRARVLRGFDDKPAVQALYERAWKRIVESR